MDDLTRIVPGLTFGTGSDPELFPRCLQACEDRGADAVMITFERPEDGNPESYFSLIRECSRRIDIPIVVNAAYPRLEDVKKFLYAGAERCAFFCDDADDMKMYPEAMLRFGLDRCVCLAAADRELPDGLPEMTVGPERYLRMSVNGDLSAAAGADSLSMLILAISPEDTDNDLFALKSALSGMGVHTDLFESAVDPADLGWDEKGLLPVIVQDVDNGEVLMLAYMNEESYRRTIATGMMTYYSRSRQSLWVKGETSGHFQYVRSLALDCDSDTILAKVRQVGAACHTGSRSCFFTSLVSRSGMHPNPASVLQDVYAVIKDRKEHPREGSYTNYLFDKGIDKILKKFGEEATETVIAAKNPDKEEIVYEAADLLYHMMVLMAERDVTWDDILNELAKRESSK